MPQVYDRHLGPVIFAPVAADLGARVAHLGPHRVLELAAGTGVATAALRDAVPDAELTATDLNPAMVTLGQQRVPSAHWQVADALDLPFPDRSFDLVACQFGVMFFPDKVAGLRECARVLEPGGRVLVVTWGDVARHTFSSALVTAVGRVLADPPAFIARVPHGYDDPRALPADLRTAGFDDVDLETVTVTGHASSAADLAEGFCGGTPLRGELATRGDVAALTRAVAAEMTAVLGEGPVSGTMEVHVGTGRRPDSPSP